MTLRDSMSTFLTDEVTEEEFQSEVSKIKTILEIQVSFFFRFLLNFESHNKFPLNFKSHNKFLLNFKYHNKSKIIVIVSNFD